MPGPGGCAARVEPSPSVDAAEGIAEDASGTGAQTAGKDAEAARRAAASHERSKA
jgi:hypothetical protein